MPLGAIAMQTLVACRQAFPWILPVDELPEFERLIAMLQIQYERHPARDIQSGSLMGGHILEFPEYSGIVGSPALPPAALWCKAVLIRWLLHPTLDTRSLDGDADRRRLSSYLRVVSPAKRDAEIDRVVQGLGENLQKIAQGQPVPRVVENPFSAVQGSQLLSGQLWRLYQTLEPWARLAAVPADCQVDIVLPSNRADRELPGLGIPVEDVFGGEGNIEAPLTKPDEEPAGDNKPEKVVRTKQAKERRAVDSHLHFLSGRVCPGHDQLLLEVESQECIVHLLNKASRTSEGDGYEPLAALSAVVSALTGRHPDLAWRAIQDWLYCARIGQVPIGDFTVGAKSWSGRMPKALYRDITDLDSMAFHPVSQRCDYPWPEAVARCLQSLEPHAERLIALDRGTTAIDAIYKELREAVTPRATFERLRSCLPVALFQVSHTKRLSQIVCGDSLSLSTAPQHYYASSAEEIRDTYARGIQAMFGLQVPRLDGADTELLVGAPAAGLKAEIVKRSVQALVAKTKKAVSGSDPIAAYTALAHYSALMFVAATGHRQTHRLSEITARDIDEQVGFAVFGDKVLDISEAARAAVIPCTVIRQLRELRQGALNLEIDLRKRGDEWSGVAKSLQAVVEGGRSLFSVCNAKTKTVRAIHREDLAKYFHDLPVPTPLLRAYLATQLLAAKAHPADIYRQMGHGLEVDLFGKDDPVNPIEWSRRLSPKVDQVIEESGWRVVWASSQIGKPPGLALHSASEIECAGERFWKARHAEFRKRARSKDSEQRDFGPLARQQLTYLLEKLVPGYATAPPRNIKMRYAEIAALQNGMNEFATNARERSRGRELLIREITRNVHRNRWDVNPRPSPFVRWRPEAASITPACVEARRWCDQVLVEILTEPQWQDCWAGGEAGAGSLVAMGALLLVIDGGVHDSKRLRAVLEGLPLAVPYPRRSDAVLVPICLHRDEAASAEDGAIQVPGSADRTSDDRPDASVTLTNASAAFALRIMKWCGTGEASRLNTYQRSVSNVGETLKRMCASRFGSSKGNALELLCRVAALGNRLRRSGLLCALQDRRLPSNDLPPYRMWELARDAVALPTGKRWDAPPRVPVLGSAIADAIEQMDDIRTNAEKMGATSRHRAKLEAIAAMRQIADSEDQSAWVRGCADWMALLYASPKLQISTISDYFGIVVKPLLKFVAAQELQEPDAETLSDVLEHLTRDVEPGTEEKRLLLFRRLVAVAEQHAAWEFPDLEPRSGEWNNGKQRESRPYLTTLREMTAAADLLRSAAEPQCTERSGESTFLRHANEQAALMGELGCISGGRTSEINGLQIQDLYRVGGKLILCIRANEIRGLKNSGSTRVIPLDGLLTEKATEVLERLRRTGDALLGTKGTSAALFRFPLASAERRWQQELPPRFSLAVSFAQGPTPSRFYSLRHTAANRWLLAALVPNSDVFNWEAFRGAPRLKEIDALEGPLRILRASRLLGHALVSTSMTHYWHFTGELCLHERSLAQQAETLREVSRITGISEQVLRNKISGKAPAKRALPYLLDSELRAFEPEAGAMRAALKDLPVNALTTPTAVMRVPLALWARVLRDCAAYGPAALWSFFSGDRKRVERAIRTIGNATVNRALGSLNRNWTAQQLSELSVTDHNNSTFGLAFPPGAVPHIAAVTTMCKRLESMKARRTEVPELVDMLDRMLRCGSQRIICWGNQELAHATDLMSRAASDLFDVAHCPVGNEVHVSLQKPQRRQGGREPSSSPASTELRFFAVAVVTYDRLFGGLR